jgi:hypothetical protein
MLLGGVMRRIESIPYNVESILVGIPFVSSDSQRLKGKPLMF